ncbi:MAG: trehalose-6-phosphate synthase [Chloroflexi bacterium]|nr:trehalose-6-phosphate synthase [Chloroflexota bacterium]
MARSNHINRPNQAEPQAARAQERLDSPDEAQVRALLRERGLVVVSNRGPVEHRLRDGLLTTSRGSGGLVTAITSLSRFVPFTWVASAIGEGDRRAAENAHPGPVPVEAGEQKLFIRYVLSSPAAYDLYYNVMSNPFLWFLQHYMWDLTYDEIGGELHDAWENGYVPVNEGFASAAVKELDCSDASPVIMVQDYQLYLVGGLVRQAVPNALMQHFIHIPWPAPRYWALVPGHMRRAILESLCACDILGFQTFRDAQNFVSTCQDHLPGAQVDYSHMTVRFRKRVTRARSYPVSIDPAALRGTARSSSVAEHEKRLRALAGERTIVRVDRLDPTKNILRGFHAYELLLKRYPEFRRGVSFLAFLVPSRSQISAYRRYAQAVFEAIDRINGEFGDSAWTPIHAFHEENLPQAIAGMRLADALLVNPVIDGMNLVAKEGPIVSERDAVLVLSETAGAFEQLREWAIPVSPADVEGTMAALRDALTMPPQERARLSKGLRQSIERNDIRRWLYTQLTDLRDLAT